MNIQEIQEFQGNMGIAHIRYPTSGNNSRKEIQPFSITKPFGISLVHNGNIINKESLTDFLNKNNIYVNSSSDSELILNLFYYYIEKDINKLTDKLIVNTISKIYDICIGSFSIIIMINNYGLIAFRDKYGIRPLIYGVDNNKIIIASESIALPTNKYNNINNGEVIIINKNLDINKYKITNELLKPCFFEYIYFARPESYIKFIEFALPSLR